MSSHGRTCSNGYVSSIDPVTGFVNAETEFRWKLKINFNFTATVIHLNDDVYFTLLSLCRTWILRTFNWTLRFHSVISVLEKIKHHLDRAGLNIRYFRRKRFHLALWSNCCGRGLMIAVMATKWLFNNWYMKLFISSSSCTFARFINFTEASVPGLRDVCSVTCKEPSTLESAYIQWRLRFSHVFYSRRESACFRSRTKAN